MFSRRRSHGSVHTAQPALTRGPLTPKLSNPWLKEDVILLEHSTWNPASSHPNRTARGASGDGEPAAPQVRAELVLQSSGCSGKPQEAQMPHRVHPAVCCWTRGPQALNSRVSAWPFWWCLLPFPAFFYTCRFLFLFPSLLLFVFALRSFSKLDISVLPLELLTESRRRCSAGQTVPAPGQGRRAGERFAAHRTACNQHREAAGAGRLPNTCPPAISGSPSEARSRAR